MKLLTFALGTRPEIIKLAPLIRRAATAGLPLEIIHTGQHYDALMDSVFFQELGLPLPDYNLHAAAETHATMLAKMFIGFEERFQAKRPSVIVVEGDVNGVFAAAFVGNRMGIPVAHVEAGLRSDDYSMPEEWNRILTDRLSDRLYTPTAEHVSRLCAEGIPRDRMQITGNTIADAVKEHKEKALQTKLPKTLEEIVEKPFALLTLHRPALVDDPARLRSVLSAIDAMLRSEKLQGIFLAHPRTRKQLPKALSYPTLTVHEPLSYFPMLHLLQRAKIILTDSGGIQEEAALLHVPCLTLRKNTERPETLRAGGNLLTGFDAAAIAESAAALLHDRIKWMPLYSVDHPSDMILEDLRSRYLT